MRSSATILHADLDSFYASVAQRDDPALRGRPVAVGHGIVLAASYEAKRRGVYTPMPGWKARQLCPDLVVVEPRFDDYMAASKAVFEIFHDTTPLVEGLSVDEAFLDVAGLARVSGSPAAIAERLRARVHDDVGLAITVGVARTKFLAKVASGVAKPDGLLVVEPDDELRFLHGLPVGRLWGVGPVTQRKLSDRGVHSVGEVAALGEANLVAMLGAAAGRHLFALAHNRDPRPIDTGRRRKSIGAQHALGRGPRDVTEIEPILLGLVDKVARRLRAAERRGRTVTVRLRFGDMVAVTRARTLSHATDDTAVLADVALAILRDEADAVQTRGSSLIGVSVADLVDRGAGGDATQLTLSFGTKPTDGLDAALDELRQRFGAGAITRGSLLGRDAGFEAPKLPD
ncbi:MAG TPA: DNA polymerase IV [Ilumatobacter sp.]|nr:DNA polymerase IV [Ilumatobacter sp.]